MIRAAAASRKNRPTTSPSALPGCEKSIIGVAIEQRHAERRSPAPGPAGAQCTSRPAARARARQVERRGEGVAAEQHDPQPMEQLRRGRIEGEQELEVVVQRGDATRLREARRPGHVVPERVERVDAQVVGLQYLRGPYRRHDARGQHRHAGAQEGPGGRTARARSGAAHETRGSGGCPCRPSAGQAHERARGDDRPEPEQPDRSAAARGSRSAPPGRSPGSARRAGAPLHPGRSPAPEGQRAHGQP